jgi:hypothetical protein
VLEKMFKFRSVSPRFHWWWRSATDVPLDNPTLLLWGIFTRFDCARDTFFEERPDP